MLPNGCIMRQLDLNATILLLIFEDFAQVTNDLNLYC